MTLDPTTLSSKRLWLRAKDITGADGSTVTAWPDQSGLSHNPVSIFTTTKETGETPSGGAVARFISGAAVNLPLLHPLSDIVGTVSSQFNSSYVAQALTDGDYGGLGWASSAAPSVGTPQWARFQFSSGTVVTSFKVYPTNTARAPKDFTIAGSNDGSSWTTLDTRTAVSWPTSAAQTFSFTNTTAYTYYRLHCTATVSADLLHLMEVEFNGLKNGDIASDADLWMVVRSSGQSSTVKSWQFGSGGASDFYPYIDAKVYSAGFASARNLAFTPTVTIVNNWRLVRITQSGGVSKMYIDGTQQQSVSSTTAAWAAAPILRGLGDIAEVLIRSTVSTTTEIADLITYFNTEHGLTVAGGSAAGTTVALPVNVGLSAAVKTIAKATVGLAVSAGLAFSATPVARTTVSLPVSAGLSFEATSFEAGTSTVDLPVSAGLDFAASTLARATVALPVSAGLSFAAGSVTSTTVDLPVSVGLEFAGPVEPPGTTMALPVTAGLSFFATATPQAQPWAQDLSRRTLLPFITSGTASATPPLALPPTGYTERPIMRRSKIVPDLRTIPGVVVDATTNQLRLPDDIYHALPVTEGEVGVPHLIFYRDGQAIDATYFRGGLTKLLTDRREEPFGEATFSFELPRVSSMDSEATTPDHPLWFLINRAGVEIHLVKSDGTSTIVWTGHVVAHDTGNSETSPNKRIDCVGALFQASTDRMHPPTFLDPTDIGTLMSRVLNGVTSRRYPKLTAPNTGIMSRQRGSWADSPLAYVQGLLSTAWTDSGNQWTISKVEGTSRGYEIRLKKTAPEWTVTNGAHGVSVDLTRDGSSIRNVIYGHGVGPDGNTWWNYHYPNLHADTAPAYPFTNPANVISIGTTDADTDSGTGVSDWQRRARDLGYSLSIDGVFNTSDATVARLVQRRFGASVDGVVGPQTWNATFGVGANAGSLNGVIRLPLAADPRTQRYLYNADGSRAALNPAWDGNVLIYADDVDFGTGITREEGIKSAQQIVDRESEPGLTGRIVLTQDPREGSRIMIPPGDKITLVGYEGADRVLHITAMERDWTSGTVTLEVDEKSRDAMTWAQIRTRNKEARRDPARRPGNPNKRSRLDVDQVVPFDGESGAGVIPKHALYGGLWTVIRIPVSELGRVAKMHVEAGAPFAMALFGAPITPAHMVSYVGNPFASDSPYQAHATDLDRHWFIEGFGQQGQRCGYWPGAEDASDPFTGVFEESGFEFASSRAPWIWVAEYAASSCFIEGNIYPATDV